VTEAMSQQLGMAYHPFDHEQRENPYPFYELLRNEEPITYSPEVDAWLVTRYKDVRALLAQPDSFSSRDLKRPMSPITPATIEILKQGFFPMVPSAVNSDGLNHRRFREPYVKALVSSRVVTYEAYIRETFNRLVDTVIADRQAEVISQFAYPLTLEVVLHVMGIPQDRMADAKQWGSDLMTLICLPLPEDRQLECARGLVAFQLYIAELITERRSNPQADLITEMINYQVPGTEPLATEELVSALCGFLMAGQKTPIDLFGNGLALLLNPRSRWEQLCAEPDLIPTAVEEILRYDGPVQILTRTTTHEVTVDGVTLPAGARVMLVSGSANRDEAQFPNANSFDMSRAACPHMAFGHGSHFCVGVTLSRLMGRIVFETLGRRLPALRLAPDQQLAHVPALQFRGYQRLNVEW
jgi:cytochrome P450